ncbi:dolichyl-phosphate-mannose-protein mannosyltransferase [Leptospira yanagawae]|uniref:Dolichyl-phosphate-mannose-protein mannosyltransferase n=1 Tax=Leptospira yanagawae TaxID=293069 RepID=A0ABY2M1Y8_9LEPT|nr:dolichyl-phosphate-mannose-protein mannosyltransferase [Leptospira yanagawae]TGL20081.1 dolichyl-phosphate-mannose-protein mannosyltransferase [Leptospira yanagawae]
MISTKNHSLYSIISISIVLLITQLLIRVDLFYISDPLIKWIQVVSLWNQNWTTESILFPAKDMDPLFLMSPLNENFVFLHQDRLIGQYPIGFTFLYSLLGIIKHQYLPYLNFIYLALLIHLMSKNKFKLPVILFAILGTVIFPLLIDFSENGLFILLSAYGYYFLFKAFESNQTKDWIFGNIFIGLSIWLRLEGILLFAAVQVTIFYIEVVINKKSVLKILHPIRYTIFALLLFSFLLWNSFSYTDPLGTRHLTNFGRFEKTILDQFQIFLSIIFTFPKKEIWTLGFFLQSPIYLITILKINKIDFKNKPTLLFHLLTTIIFLVLVGITSPNDGLTLNGRYLAIMVFPFTFILNEVFSDIQNEKLKYYSVMVWTILCTIFILIVFFFSSKELKKLKAELSNFQSNLVVTTSEVLSGGFTLDLIEKQVLCVRRDFLSHYFYYNLKQNKYPDFLLLNLKKETNMSEEEIDSYNAILNESNSNGYICTPAKESAKIKSQKCVHQNF